MAHPTYSQTTLETLTTKELKTIASQIGAIPDGDKRAKQTWVSAVIDHQTKFSPVKVAAMSAHIETIMNRLEPRAAETEAIDTYVPIPRTHADDVAFAAAMGLTYDDVFGEPIAPIQPIEEPQPVAHTPTLIPVLAVAIVLLCSIAIIPALIIGSIAISLGQPKWRIPLSQPIDSTS
jgi:hypothetical protein